MLFSNGEPSLHAVDSGFSPRRSAHNDTSDQSDRLGQCLAVANYPINPAQDHFPTHTQRSAASERRRATLSV